MSRKAEGYYYQKGYRMKLLWMTMLTITISTGALAQRGMYRHQDGMNSHHRGQKMELIKIPIILNEHLRGLNVIPLKKLIIQNNRGIKPGDLANAKLVNVKLVAKSKKGMGEAVLVVGQNTTYPKTVTGSPGLFQSNRPMSFDRIVLKNRSMNSKGKWQIELKGNIKVKKVVVTIKQKVKVKHISLRLRGQQLQGQNTLKLKQLIKQKTGMQNLKDLKLKKVTLVAKSKKGRGTATLVVGNQPSYPETIMGTPGAFNAHGPRGYSSVTINNPSQMSSQGKWQIELQGNIKVLEVIVTVKGKSSIDQRIGRFDRFGSFGRSI